MLSVGENCGGSQTRKVTAAAGEAAVDAGTGGVTVAAGTAVTGGVWEIDAGPAVGDATAQAASHSPAAAHAHSRLAVVVRVETAEPVMRRV